MRWVPHLRINTRVRVLGRRTEQHARGPVKNRRPLFRVQNWAADFKKNCKVMSASCTIHSSTHSICRNRQALSFIPPRASRWQAASDWREGVGGTHS